MSASHDIPKTVRLPIDVMDLVPPPTRQRVCLLKGHYR